MGLKSLLLDQAEGKAIRAHPALMDANTPMSIYSPGQQPVREQAKISQTEAKRHLTAYGGDQSIDWVMDAIGLYIDAATKADWSFQRDGVDYLPRKVPNIPPEAQIAPSDLVDLFEQPNPFMPWSEHLALAIIDLLLVGNAYWYKHRTTSEGKPLALYRLAPPYVKIVPGPMGVKRYDYEPPGAPGKLEIDPENVIHFKRPNPHSAYYGLGVIAGGGRAMDLELALTDSQASYYENKADPSLIVESERRVPRDVFNKLRMQLRNRIGGTKRSGELLVLEAGLKATSISPNAHEAAFEQITKLSRDRIWAMFRASPKLFGVIETGSGSDKISDARREFDNNVMLPFLGRFAELITLKLTRAWNLDFKFNYSYIMPQEELVKLSGDFASIPGVKVREVRRFMKPLGIEESTGDPEIDEMVLNLPGEELDEDGQGGFADRNLPREPGRPPNGENTEPFPRNGRPLPPNARVRRPAGKALTAADETLTINEVLDRLRVAEARAAVREKLEGKAADNVRTTVGNRLPDEERPSDPLVADRTRDVDAVASFMEDGILQAVNTLERGLLDHVEGKAFDPGSLVKRIRRSESWATFMSMLTGVLEEGARRAVASAVIHQGTTGRTVDDEIDYEAVARSVVHRSEGVRSISNNLRDEIVQKVAKAVKEGAERPDVERAIRESIDFWRGAKAETVALTEAVHAYNEGTLTVFEETGVEEVVVSDGEDHDDACAEANGQVWTIDYARGRRLEHPRCRRAFVPVG